MVRSLLKSAIGLLALNFCTQSCFAAPPQGSTGPCFTLDELSSINGKFKVFVRPDAVHVDHLTHGYSLISHAPDWDVYVYRNDTHKFARVPYAKWLKVNLILIGNSWTMELTKPLSESHIKSNGQSCVMYKFGKTVLAKSYFNTVEKSDNADIIERSNNWAEVYCLDFPPDKHAGGVIARVSGLPELKGIPMTTLRKTATTSSWSLKNLSCVKNATLPDSLFVVPKGFTEVPYSRDMISSSDQKDAINEMLGP